MTFFDLCGEIWAGAPATNGIEGEWKVIQPIATFIRCYIIQKHLIKISLLSLLMSRHVCY